MFCCINVKNYSNPWPTLVGYVQLDLCFGWLWYLSDAEVWMVTIQGLQQYHLEPYKRLFWNSAITDFYWFWKFAIWKLPVLIICITENCLFRKFEYLKIACFHDSFSKIQYLKNTEPKNDYTEKSVHRRCPVPTATTWLSGGVMQPCPTARPETTKRKKFQEKQN